MRKVIIFSLTFFLFLFTSVGLFKPRTIFAQGVWDCNFVFGTTMRCTQNEGCDNGYCPSGTCPNTSDPSLCTGGGSCVPCSVNWGQLKSASIPNYRNASLGEIITDGLTWLFPIAGLLLLLYLIYGGFRLLTSAGSPDAVSQAKGTITTALVGFAVVFVAYWVVQIVATILGINTQGLFPSL